MSSSKVKTGVRGITMQQPFAQALVAGQCRYTRRGKATRFAEGGEWVAIHCGSNNEHLNNGSLMAAVRKAWPGCPADVELKDSQRKILGFVHMVDGEVPATSKGPQSCPILKEYKCSKAVCWEADAGVPLPGGPIEYPKGNLQIWNLFDEGFTDKSQGGAAFRSKVPSTVKSEPAGKHKRPMAEPAALPKESKAKKVKKEVMKVTDSF